MRSSTTLVSRDRMSHAARPALRVGRLALVLALVCQSLLPAFAPAAAAQRRINSKRLGVEASEADAPTTGGTRQTRKQRPVAAPAPVTAPVTAPTVAPAPQEGEGPRVNSARVTATRTAQVTFKGIEALERRAAAGKRKPAANFPQDIHSPLRINEAGAGRTKTAPAAEGDTGAGGAPAQDGGGPLVPSPAPATNYRGHNDVPKGGGTSGTVIIPPDTMGAVGLTKNLVMLNNNMVVQDKTTGAQLSLVSMDAFWSPTGATGTFDPRVVFDPYQRRWIVAAVSNAATPESSVLVGLSATSDPQSTFTLFRFVVGCANGAQGCAAGGEWADFPMLGFSPSFVAVGWNQFTSDINAFVAGKMLVLNYPLLRTGEAGATTFTIDNDGDGDFCMHPATNLSDTEGIISVPVHVESASATYRMHKIIGSPNAPIFLFDQTLRTRPGGPWTQPTGDILPQACTAPACATAARGIEAGDAFIRSNVVFRNNLIYYAQTVALPAGVLNANTRFAAQWTALNPDGTFNTGGRVEDPAATRTNGGRHYSYPSIVANKNNDVLMGFTEFESDDNPDAAYAFRLGTDAAGTMRDPVVYKEGLGYYEKTFSGARNRWGDYSHTVVDPVNDRDMWTLQEVADVPVGTGNGSGRWDTWWAKVLAPAGAGDLLISEFRLRGPGGANDEFVEVYNATGAPLSVTTLDGSAGYAIAAQDNVVRCTIPNGTTIPARGHFLCVNSAGYSLAAYPAGDGTTATGDATYTNDIPDNNGVAVFNTATVASFSTATRLDAVGFTTTPPSAYVEGAGIPALGGTAYLAGIDHALVRDDCGKGGSATALGPCPTGGLPKDTNNNAADFYFVDTNATSAGAGQRLGAPGPENLSSPVQRNGGFTLALLDSSTAASNPPNRIRDFMSDPENDSTLGTLSIRRRVVNNTGGPVTRLRFRVVDQTTFPPPAGFADLRARTSTPVVVGGVNDAATCGPAPAPCTVTVLGTTLEEPPAQSSGGGFNATLAAGTITLAQPLANGASVNLQFLLGIQQTGTFKFFVNVEALP